MTTYMPAFLNCSSTWPGFKNNELLKSNSVTVYHLGMNKPRPRYLSGPVGRNQEALKEQAIGKRLDRVLAENGGLLESEGDLATELMPQLGVESRNLVINTFRAGSEAQTLRYEVGPSLGPDALARRVVMIQSLSPPAAGQLGAA